MGVRLKTTERMCRGRDWDLSCSIRQTSPRRAAIRPQIAAECPWNALGAEPRDDVSTDLPEPMLIITQLPDVDPAPTKTYHSDNKGTRNVYIRKTGLEQFGYSAVRVDLGNTNAFDFQIKSMWIRNLILECRLVAKRHP